tara:strand:+ start:74 stop:205 length:132 start_codon:yes stop_codon:yes gene_type:complete
MSEMVKIKENRKEVTVVIGIWFIDKDDNKLRIVALGLKFYCIE